jgi:ssDNA-binding Zn-finger/Zn-ribbon topoisomerase 1
VKPFVPQEVVEFCPKCGTGMVRKAVKTGQMAGKEFMVCSKYPESKTAIEVKLVGDL